MTADRCHRCDRPQSECDRRDASMALTRASKGKRVAVGAYVSAEYQAALTRLCKADATCKPVPWRTRCLAAESARDAAEKRAEAAEAFAREACSIGEQGWRTAGHPHDAVQAAAVARLDEIRAALAPAAESGKEDDRG